MDVTSFGRHDMFHGQLLIYLTIALPKAYHSSQLAPGSVLQTSMSVLGERSIHHHPAITGLVSLDGFVGLHSGSMSDREIANDPTTWNFLSTGTPATSTCFPDASVPQDSPQSSASMVLLLLISTSTSELERY